MHEISRIPSEQLADRILEYAENSEKLASMRSKQERYKARCANCRRMQDEPEKTVLASESDKARYDKLLVGTMHGYTLDIVYDYLNIVFGKDPDTEDFWEQILLPQTALAFGYPRDKLSRPKANLNALLFAFAHHFGLDLQFDSTIELGHRESPFTDQVLDICGKSKAYRLRNVPYCVLAGKHRVYKSIGKKELSLKALKLKVAIARQLDSRADVDAVADIAETLLEEGVTEKAIEMALQALQTIHPLHATNVKLCCLLLRACYEKDDAIEGDKYWVRATAALYS